MNDQATYLYLRARGVAAGVRAAALRVLFPPAPVRPNERGMLIIHKPEEAGPQAGLSKLATTVILLAVAVALTLAVVAIVAPEILGLAERTGDQIRDVPLDSW